MQTTVFQINGLFLSHNFKTLHFNSICEINNAAYVDRIRKGCKILISHIQRGISCLM